MSRSNERTIARSVAFQASERGRLQPILTVHMEMAMIVRTWQVFCSASGAQSYATQQRTERYMRPINRVCCHGHVMTRSPDSNSARSLKLT